MAAGPPAAAELRRPPPAEAVARLRHDVESLTGEAPSNARRLGLAVSGGGDSMALLLLAHAAFPGGVTVATVDHGLRAEAACEAALVASLCAALGVPHVVLGPPGDRIGSAGVQEQARALRYRMLGAWAADTQAPWVATAHQRDDVAESFLLRARRGSGVGGLAAMPRMRRITGGDRQSPLLIRPLLGWSRAELEGIVGCAGAPSVADPSNIDPAYDRSRIRALLAATPELTPGRLARAAENLRHAEDALQWLLDRELPERFAAESEPGPGGPAAILDVANLPYELRRRLVHRAIDHVRHENGRAVPWHEQGLDRLTESLGRGEPGTLADVLARPEGDRWRFTLAPPRRSH